MVSSSSDDSSSDSSSSSSDEEGGHVSKNAAAKKTTRERYELQRRAERNLIKVVKAYRHLPTMRMSMGQRRFLFFWHLAVILVSVGIVGIGAFLTYWFDVFLLERAQSTDVFNTYNVWTNVKGHNPKLSAFYGPIIEEYGRALMVLGLTYLIVTFFYISFLGHRFQFTWPILVLINIVALVFELSNILVRLSPVAQLASTQQGLLESALSKYKIKSSDEFSLSYDFLSIWGKCCGVSSVYDFQKLKYTYKPGGSGTLEKTFQVPPVCCKEDIFKLGEEAVSKCAQEQDGTYENGCFNVFFDLFNSFKAVYVFAIGFFLMDLVVHISIYRDMVARLEPELGIEKLCRLEKIRLEQATKTKNTAHMFLSASNLEGPK